MSSGLMLVISPSILVPGKLIAYSFLKSSRNSDANTHSCPNSLRAKWKPPKPANKSMNENFGFLMCLEYGAN